MDPKDFRLFHYTSQLGYLIDILRNGFWPRYCVEEFDWLIEGRIPCIAFPIVCFCDIPIPAAHGHRVRYGSYAVAVSKAAAPDYDINPVWYLLEESFIARHLKEIFAHQPRFTLETVPPPLKPILPFLKTTIGVQPDREATRDGTLEVLPFEEELEWRHSPHQLINTWRFGYGREILDDDCNELSKAHRLELDFADIEAVFVTSEEEVEQMKIEFPDLEDRVVLWP